MAGLPLDLGCMAASDSFRDASRLRDRLAALVMTSGVDYNA